MGVVLVPNLVFLVAVAVLRKEETDCGDTLVAATGLADLTRLGTMGTRCVKVKETKREKKVQGTRGHKVKTM